MTSNFLNSKVGPSEVDFIFLTSNPGSIIFLKAGSVVEESSGQYLWHFDRPPSESLHTETIKVTFCSRIILQKCPTVLSLGPYAAMIF
jgi:hypothetical protein